MEIFKCYVPPTDLYWLAGLLEGEGSFLSSRSIVNGKLYHYPKIVVTMTDKDVIDRAAAIFETNTYWVPNQRPNDRKDQFRAQISGARAASLMSELYPIMGCRRQEKIDEVLNAYESLESTEIRRSRSCSDAQKKRRTAEKENLSV